VAALQRRAAPRESAVRLAAVENSEKLAQYAARHRPFYEQLYAQRMDVSPWERMTGP